MSINAHYCTLHQYCPFVTQSIVEDIMDLLSHIFIDILVSLSSRGYQFNQPRVFESLSN